jgi:hypothetical protein
MVDGSADLDVGLHGGHPRPPDLRRLHAIVSLVLDEDASDRPLPDLSVCRLFWVANGFYLLGRSLRFAVAAWPRSACGFGRRKEAMRHRKGRRPIRSTLHLKDLVYLAPSRST